MRVLARFLVSTLLHLQERLAELWDTHGLKKLIPSITEALRAVEKAMDILGAVIEANAI